MSDTEVEFRLVDILREVAADPELQADKATMLQNIPEWDSMSTVEAILLIEKEFAIDILFDKCHGAVTVGELSAFISEAVAGDVLMSCPVRCSPLTSA